MITPESLLNPATPLRFSPRMTLTLEQFQKDAAPLLAKIKQTGETLLLVAGQEKFEVRPASAHSPDEALAELQELLPKRDIIVGDPEDLVHLDWSSEWRL